MTTEKYSADILIVGAGAAGLCVAIHAAPRRVLVLAPDAIAASCTELARGGIAAPLASGDSIPLHVADTRHAAGHSGCEFMTHAIIDAARQTIEFLDDSGVRFDRDGDAPHMHLEAGHSRARILHADGDATGAAIHTALLARAKGCAHIEFMMDVSVVSLLSGAMGIAGVLALRANRIPLLVRAGTTVLATGGLGQLFAATTNSRYATGDGLAMALMQNAAVAGLEFVQFHPTALRCALDPLPLLTEALRGAGARLIRDDGVHFMPAIDPRAELAPRDIVARAVWQTQQAGHEVLLDTRQVFATKRAADFPSALAACRAQGIDPARTPIPVTSAAHFHMGGLVVDAQGRSSIPGLWACGEVAYTGMHGANRLASNSLLEAVVGRATGRALAGQRYISVTCKPDEPIMPIPVDTQRTEWQQLRQLMWAAMGPVRRAADLDAALRQIPTLKRALDPGETSMRHRFCLAEAMIRAALDRRESRGAHWRSDYPQRNRSLDGRQALLASSHLSVLATSL